MENVKRAIDKKGLEGKNIIVVHNKIDDDQTAYLKMMDQFQINLKTEEHLETPFVLFDKYFNETVQHLLKATHSNYETRQQQVDKERPEVIVVGCGLAGLVAAYESASQGARVTIVEKENKCFGNSIKASSAFNVVGSPAQKALNISDSAELFYNDTMKAGKQRNDKDLVTLLTASSLKAYEFLNENFGIELNELNANVSGHSELRSLIPKMKKEGRVMNVGATLVLGIMERLQEMRLVTIKNNARVTKLLKKKDRVVGVQLEQGDQLHAGSVVLATGGFSASSTLLQKYAKSKSKLPTSNGPQTTGDGITLGLEVGAKVIHMEAVQVQPTCIQNEKTNKTFYAPETFRQAGAILINSKGQRFVNELLSEPNEINRAIARHGRPTKMTSKAVFMLMNEEVMNELGPVANFYKNAGGLARYESIDELCSATSLPLQRLKKTLFLYQKYADKGVDPYRKRSFKTTFKQGPYYIVSTTPCVHYTMGGLKFNRHAQVLTKNKRPISGLYAAGEVTGGLHGSNRFTGNALLESVVFGRIAGASAV
eukprot:CAMPEP_0117420742 /NCGR_PEP_ID=MMETSP0758-20121206/2009_1 /TAXON_ID=63605 /ORGANISM="Percolomonas cosmopolitus, Strain AE-1 (ATCC 50343)" /LENGTH=539 /DNA_ID=CAMNT_0005202521 /DNA_START=778 /DNA_END=2394 /DNA_ORIENTATION=-